jgi:cytochrome c
VRRVTITALGCAIAISASLLLAEFHPFGDADLYASPDSHKTFMEGSSVPAAVKEVLVTKCADCHSERVHAPLYSRFAPISWLIERDIIRGRNALNLSQWDSYGEDRQQILAAKIVQETRSGDMPLLQYRIIHRGTKIEVGELATFEQWARSSQTQGISGTAALVAEGDPARGKDVFDRRCLGCHSLARNREGPNLHGVYGRTSGAATGFPYSSALSDAHFAWDEPNLDRWLSDPDAMVPGNNMDFHVSKQQERRDLISFLKKEAGR